MADKKRKRIKGLVLIDANWVKATGADFYLDVERNIESPSLPVLPISVTTFNMEDGSFLEMEYYVPTDKGGEALITAFVPKHSVMLVLTGDGVERSTGFKKH